MVSISASARWCPVAYFDLSLLAGLGAHRLDDVTVVTPDFLIVDSQATLIPAANVDVGKAVFPDLLEVHDFIPWGRDRYFADDKCSSILIFFIYFFNSRLVRVTLTCPVSLRSGQSGWSPQTHR